MLTAHNQLQPSTGHKPVLAATFATQQQTQQRNLVSQDDDLFGTPGALLGSRFGAALGIDATICSACESPRHTTEASQPPSGSVIRSLQIVRLVFDAGACGLGLVEPLKLWRNISPSDFTCESPRCSLIMFLGILRQLIRPCQRLSLLVYARCSASAMSAFCNRTTSCHCLNNSCNIEVPAAKLRPCNVACKSICSCQSCVAPAEY